MKKVIMDIKYGKIDCQLFGIEDKGEVAYSESSELPKEGFLMIKDIKELKPYAYDNAIDNGDVIEEMKAYIKYHNDTEPEEEQITIIKTTIIKGDN